MSMQETSGREISILVVDDDEMVRGTLCENLRDAGFTVAAAPDGAAALALIAGGRTAPDVVITDIVMPHKEGLETILQIRRTQPQIRLIAISGGGRSRGGDFLEMAAKLGADAALPKPIDLDMLEATVRRLAGAGMRMEANGPEPAATRVDRVAGA